jgi:uncharacterized protein (DUF779 family)
MSSGPADRTFLGRIADCDFYIGAAQGGLAPHQLIIDVVRDAAQDSRWKRRKAYGS